MQNKFDKNIQNFIHKTSNLKKKCIKTTKTMNLELVLYAIAITVITEFVIVCRSDIKVPKVDHWIIKML